MTKGTSHEGLSKILVVVDPTTENQVVLARAVTLASKCNAQVTVFLSIFDFSYEMTSILSNQEREAMRQGVIDQRLAWIQDLLAAYTHLQLNIDTQVIFKHNRPFESIINHAISGQYDLIVKGTHATTNSKR